LSRGALTFDLRLSLDSGGSGGPVHAYSGNCAAVRSAGRLRVTDARDNGKLINFLDTIGRTGRHLQTRRPDCLCHPLRCAREAQRRHYNHRQQRGLRTADRTADQRNPRHRGCGICGQYFSWRAYRHASGRCDGSLTRSQTKPGDRNASADRAIAASSSTTSATAACHAATCRWNLIRALQFFEWAAGLPRTKLSGRMNSWAVARLCHSRR
jgi:hypothetical protein